MARRRTVAFWLMIAVVVLSDKASSQSNNGLLSNLFGLFNGPNNATENNGVDDGNFRQTLKILAGLVNATQNGGLTLPNADENALSQLLGLIGTLSNAENTTQDNGFGDLLNLLSTFLNPDNTDQDNGLGNLLNLLNTLSNPDNTNQDTGLGNLLNLLNTLLNPDNTDQDTGLGNLLNLLNTLLNPDNTNQDTGLGNLLNLLNTLLNPDNTDQDTGLGNLLNLLNTLLNPDNTDQDTGLGNLLNLLNTFINPDNTNQDTGLGNLFNLLNTFINPDNTNQDTGLGNLLNLLNTFINSDNTNQDTGLGNLLKLINTLFNPDNTNQNNGLGNLLNFLTSLSSSTNRSEAGLLPADLLEGLLVGQTDGSNSVSNLVDTILSYVAVDNEVLQVLLDTPMYRQLIGYLNDDGTNGTTNSTAALDITNLLATAMPFVQQYVQNYIDAFFRDNGVTERCRDDMGVMIQGVLEQQMWALQMLDAFGKPGSDILTGQYKWLGSYEECVKVEAVTFSNNTIKSDPVEQFTGKYCRATFPIGGEEIQRQTQALGGVNAVIGTCVPSSCSSSDIAIISETVQKAVMNGNVAINAEITCVEDKEMETDTVIVICILIILTAFVVIGTLYDVIAVQMRSSDSIDEIATIPNVASKPSASYLNSYVPAAISHDFKSNTSAYDPVRLNSDGYTNGGYTASDIANSRAENSNSINKLGELKHNDAELNKVDKANTDAVVQKAPVKQRGTVEQVVLSFSAYSNGVKILGTQQGAGALGAINGIRFLSMCWVILGHTYYFGQGFDGNLLSHYVKKLNDWTFMSVTYATVAVDSFFVISGILVAYLSLKELKKVGGALKMNWFMFYFHRFWRLTPPYMLVLMVGTVILPYVYSGPLWTDGEFPTMSYCRESWWTNLLYINNYVKVDKLCMGWSWYLANDMQFYIISPLILLPLFYNLIAGSLSCLVFLTATIITTALVTIHHEYPAQFLSPYAPPAKDNGYGKNIYFPSYARMGPYIVGLFTGYVLYRCKCKCRIPKIINLVCWLISFGLCIVSVYSLYSEDDTHIFTKEESSAFMALRRTGWGIAVSWIVFSCATGHGGWINEILSWKAFIPLGRLTYCAYLIHPLLIVLFYSGRRQASYFTDYDAAYLFIGHLVMSYGVAFVVSLVFESPMMGLEKAIFAKRKRK